MLHRDADVPPAGRLVVRPVASPERLAALRARLVAAGLEPAAAAPVEVVLHEGVALDAVALLEARRGEGPPVVVLLSSGDRGLRRALLRAGAAEVVALEGADDAVVARAVENALERAVGVTGSRRLLTRVVDQLFAFVALLDLEGTVLEASRPPLAVGGVTIDDVRGKKFWDTYWWSFDEDGRQRLRAACERAARGDVVRYDAVARTAGDGGLAIDFQVAPLRDAQGRITHLVPSAVDITPRLRAEAEQKRAGTSSRARWTCFAR